jgi:hypothetical protein
VIDEQNIIEDADEPLSSETAGSTKDEYRVGPGHPPLESQFKKGAPSPNPKGRPRKDATALPDVKKLFEEALNKKFKLKKGDKDVFLTRTALGIDQLLNQFAKGDRHARRDLMDMAEKFGVDLLAGQKAKIQEALQPNHQAILDAYVARQLPQPAPAFQPRVNAPNELRDGLTDLKVTRPVVRLDIKPTA